MSTTWQHTPNKPGNPDTQNPQYSDVMYVESLIGPDTVATVPPETLERFRDHGRIAMKLDAAAAAEAGQVLDALAKGGIDIADVSGDDASRGGEDGAMRWLNVREGGISLTLMPPPMRTRSRPK